MMLSQQYRSSMNVHELRATNDTFHKNKEKCATSWISIKILILSASIVTSRIWWFFRKKKEPSSAHHDVKMLCLERTDRSRSFRPSDTTSESTATGQRQSPYTEWHVTVLFSDFNVQPLIYPRYETVWDRSCPVIPLITEHLLKCFIFFWHTQQQANHYCRKVSAEQQSSSLSPLGF